MDLRLSAALSGHPEESPTLEIDTAAGRDRLPRMTDKPQMPFTHAVILEVMRLAAPIHSGVMHAAAQDTTLRGFLIPKGAMLISNIWGVHHDPDVWREPNQFDPSRFLDENGEVIDDNEALIPFSVGKFTCPCDSYPLELITLCVQRVYF